MQTILSEKLQKTLNELERMTDPFYPANTGDKKPNSTVTIPGIHQTFKKPQGV